VSTKKQKHLHAQYTEQTSISTQSLLIALLHLRDTTFLVTTAKTLNLLTTSIRS